MLSRCAVVVLLSVGTFSRQQLAQSAETSPLLQAKVALEEARFTDAEMLLNTAIKQQPKSAELYYYLGLSLHQQFRLGEAIAAYENAIKLNASYDLPHINLGLALVEMKRLEQASDVFEQVLDLPNREASPASNHTLAHYNRAIIFKRQDQTKAALTEAQAALAISPNFEPAQQLVQILSSPSSP